ncbi:MAG: hypothetical protein F6K24_31320 [Okeania sp. SIO2D1]|nr:hypothetical protein [Okeania sp. SIO2D1]
MKRYRGFCYLIVFVTNELVGYRVEIYSRGVMLLRSGALFGDRSSAEIYAKSAIDGMT